MKFIRLRRKFIPESKSSVLRIVAHDLAARITCRGLGFDPDCLSKYFSSVEHGVHVHTLTRFQFPLIGRLTIAKKARAYVESHTHFLFTAEGLHRDLVLNGIQFRHRAPDQRHFLLGQCRQIQQRVMRRGRGGSWRGLRRFIGVRRNRRWLRLGVHRSAKRQ